MVAWDKSWENSCNNLQEISTKTLTRMVGSNRSSKMKTKNKSTLPLTWKSNSSIPTTIESETPVTTTPYASTTFSCKPKIEDLLEMISIQDNKIDKLTKRVTNLEQMLRETQSFNLIATNTSELLKMEVDKLKQYSRRSFLVISGVELLRKKTTKSAEETEEKVCRIIETNSYISKEDFDYELYKVHRLPPNKKVIRQKQINTQASEYHM